MKKKILFISDEKNIKSDISGGVQICTKEFLTYLKAAGFEPIIYTIKTDISIFKRLKIKIGVEVYDRYDFKSHINEIKEVISKNSIELVALNQLNLCPIINDLQPLLSSKVQFYGFSHGNESGDYLHDIAKLTKPTHLQTWKLGKLLIKENDFFSNLLDGIVIISEQELYINNWIGCTNLLFLPRILKPDFLSTKAIANVAGFVGTLDHLPNRHGLTLLANSLAELNFNGQLRIVGAPTHIGEQLALNYPFIHYCGQLSDTDLEQEVSRWTIFLNPVFWYSRGSSTKLAQAINWGLATLSTPAGRRGYSLVDDTLITAKNSPAHFAAELIQILKEEKKIVALRRASVVNATAFNISSWSEKLKEFLK